MNGSRMNYMKWVMNDIIIFRLKFQWIIQNNWFNFSFFLKTYNVTPKNPNKNTYKQQCSRYRIWFERANFKQSIVPTTEWLSHDHIQSHLSSEAELVHPSWKQIVLIKFSAPLTLYKQPNLHRHSMSVTLTSHAITNLLINWVDNQ